MGPYCWKMVPYGTWHIVAPTLYESMMDMSAW